MTEPRASAELREAWRRWRVVRALDDPQAESFGGAREGVDPNPVRLLVLPADPDAHLVEFDDDFWAWWAADYDDPASGGATRWGAQRRPTWDAGIVGHQHTEAEWWRYIALHRNAGLDAGLGRDCAIEYDDKRYFRLIAIVGRAWASLARYGQIVERYSPAGPWEITLSLLRTADAELANFGEGWAEPGQGFGGSRHQCQEPGLLLRREIAAWPAEADAIRDIAFSLGAQIEDAWRNTERRFLARAGDLTDGFDRTRFGWE